jgi:hypothetical protein
MNKATLNVPMSHADMLRELDTMGMNRETLMAQKQKEQAELNKMFEDDKNRVQNYLNRIRNPNSKGGRRKSRRTRSRNSRKRKGRSRRGGGPKEDYEREKQERTARMQLQLEEIERQGQAEMENLIQQHEREKQARLEKERLADLEFQREYEKLRNARLESQNALAASFPAAEARMNAYGKAMATGDQATLNAMSNVARNKAASWGMNVE